MEKIPQIVSERLKAASVGAHHPDADLLTAFSERSLSKAEQAFVLQHLGVCQECREVVALALPPVHDVQTVMRPSTAGWLTWPLVRWGAIAAGVALVGSFGLIEYQHRQEAYSSVAYTSSDSGAKEATNATPPVPTQVPDHSQAQGASSEGDQPAPKGITAGAHEPEAPASSAPMLVRVNPPSANLQHGPHIQSQQNATFQNQAGSVTAPTPPARVLVARPVENVPVPTQTEALAVASAPPAAQNQTANLDAQVARLESPSAVQPPESKVERSKPATLSTTGGPQPAKVDALNSNAVNGRNIAGIVAASPSAPVTWNVTSDGTLQRSFDQGASWQNVDFEGRADGRASMRVAAKQSASDALKKDAQNHSFRAVASNGPDVWAGASGGVLYHSTDSGGHWVRVIPSASGTSLSGEIVSLEFVDSQHGRIVTAAPEVWSTSDGGQSWQKQ